MDTDILKRYTNIPALIYMLRNQSITMLNPKSWDDKNDIYFLEQYKKKLGLKTLLALCFTGTFETYHHWHVFSGGPSGVCISFKKKALIDKVFDIPGISHGEVNYETIEDMRKEKIEIPKLPYIKRYGYQDEGEYRIIFEDKATDYETKNIKFTLDCIEKVTINPWLHKSLSDALKAEIHSIKGFKNLRVTKSTLVSNSEWKRFAQAAV